MLTLLLLLSICWFLPAHALQLGATEGIRQTALLSPNDLRVRLQNDNADASLPIDWRFWWKLDLKDVDTQKPTSVTVSDNGRDNYYLPVFSYDGVEWKQFDPSEVTMQKRTLRIHTRFKAKSVWLARWHPYSTSELEGFLKAVREKPQAKVEVIGKSQLGRNLYSIRISEDASLAKEEVVILARVHAGEVASSFVTEGFVRFVLGETPAAVALRRTYDFTILPMQNPDGVALGNSYTTPRSQHLDALWVRSFSNPFELAFWVPPEVKASHGVLARLAKNKKKIVAALNLHSSWSHNNPAYFVTHFGPKEKGYNEDEARLFEKQTQFIARVRNIYDTELIAPPASDGGRNWYYSNFPESWFWTNFKADVMAMTLESVLGKGGKKRGWVTPEDQRTLGAALAQALLHTPINSVGENTKKEPW